MYPDPHPPVPVSLDCGSEAPALSSSPRKTESFDGTENKAAASLPHSKNRCISFYDELRMTEGTKEDWKYFARWHYRSHTLGPVRRITLLWHNDLSGLGDQKRIGICVFCAPAAQLRLRNQFFGLSFRSRTRSRPRPRFSCPSVIGSRFGDGNGDGDVYGSEYGEKLRTFLKELNRQLWLLSRVVLHPTYRGAGIAAAFVRRSCQTCPAPWIETLSTLGHISPLFEHAGFRRIGVIRKTWKRESVAALERSDALK